MRNKNTFILSTLMLLPIFLTAQIGLNTSTLSGNASIGYQTLQFGSGYYKTLGATFNPTYGKFVGKKTLLSFQPLAEFQKHKVNYGPQSSDEVEYKKLGLNVGLRHYLNPYQAIKLYGQANVGLSKYTYTFENASRNFEQAKLQLGAAIGANYFLNKTIALDAQIGYVRSQTKSKFESGFNNFYINVGLANFMSAESETGEGAELIAKGRKTIGGNIGLSTSVFGLGYQAKAEYGQFITKGLMVGGSIEGSNNLELARFNSAFKVDVWARYYVPITKKLFIYPEAKVAYSSQSINHFRYDFGVGMSYFIKKNVALDIDLFRLSKSGNHTNIFGGANVGLKLFLK